MTTTTAPRDVGDDLGQWLARHDANLATTPTHPTGDPSLVAVLRCPGCDRGHLFRAGLVGRAVTTSCQTRFRLGDPKGATLDVKAPPVPAVAKSDPPARRQTVGEWLADHQADVATWEPFKAAPRCAVEACERERITAGLCKGHHFRARYHGRKTGQGPKTWAQAHWSEVLAWPAMDGPGRPTCTVPGCPRDTKNAGLCASHYQRAASLARRA